MPCKPISDNFKFVSLAINFSGRENELRPALAGRVRKILISQGFSRINFLSVKVDGCGWVIWISSDSYYRPINLEKDFEIHGLKILIDFEETREEGHCGFPHPTPNFIPEIRIHRIKHM